MLYYNVPKLTPPGESELARVRGLLRSGQRYHHLKAVAWATGTGKLRLEVSDRTRYKNTLCDDLERGGFKQLSSLSFVIKDGCCCDDPCLTKTLLEVEAALRQANS